MTSVRELMATEIVSVAPELTLRSAVELFAVRHIGGAPVRSGSRLVEASSPPLPATDARPDWDLETSGEWREGDDAPAAFFSDLWADTGEDVLERFEQATGPEGDMLAEHTVSEAMSRRVVHVAPETPVPSAARLMSRHELHRLLVLEEGKLCGVLSAMDVVRAVAEGRL